RVDTSDDTLMEDVSNQGKIIDELDKDKEVVAAVSETVSAVAVVSTVTTDVVPAATVTHAPVKVVVPSTKRRRGVNTDGFRLDYFKGMSYDDIRSIFEAKFNSNIEFLLKTKEQIEEE
nr:hypothetical protein [Tanacetum cinerariifolium]